MTLLDKLLSSFNTQAFINDSHRKPSDQIYKTELLLKKVDHCMYLKAFKVSLLAVFVLDLSFFRSTLLILDREFSI